MYWRIEVEYKEGVYDPFSEGLKEEIRDSGFGDGDRYRSRQYRNSGH